MRRSARRHRSHADGGPSSRPDPSARAVIRPRGGVPRGPRPRLPVTSSWRRYPANAAHGAEPTCDCARCHVAEWCAPPAPTARASIANATSQPPALTRAAPARHHSMGVAGSTAAKHAVTACRAPKTSTRYHLAQRVSTRTAPARRRSTGCRATTAAFCVAMDTRATSTCTRHHTPADSATGPPHPTMGATVTRDLSRRLRVERSRARTSRTVYGAQWQLCRAR